MTYENSLATLLGDAAAAGLHLRLEGETAVAVGPRERLTPDLRARLAEMKPDLIELLRAHGDGLLDLFRRRPA